jgi:hypothetical protein
MKMLGEIPQVDLHTILNFMPIFKVGVHFVQVPRSV